MIMKRLAYAVLAAIMILSGCEYHPYYDGQKFRLYHRSCGVVEEDGAVVNIPVVTEKPFAINLLGGSGKNHYVHIEDPEYLDYEISEGDVVNEAFDTPEFIPVSVVLKPKKLGETSVTLTEGDTGESITLKVRICEAYKALKIYNSDCCLEKETILCFRYGGPDNVMKICKGDLETSRFHSVIDATYAFVKEKGSLYFDISFPADEYGYPNENGNVVDKRFLVSSYYSIASGSVDDIIRYLNIQDIPIQTKSYDYPDYYVDFQFIDVTDKPLTEAYGPSNPSFYAYTAVIIPWLD